MITLINHQGLKQIAGIQLQSPSPPIGLAYLGAYLKLHGYFYTGIDACGEAMDQTYSHTTKDVLVQGLSSQEVLDRVPKNTSIFGFSCLFSHCFPLVHELVTLLKKQFPDALFVAGGEHSSAMPEATLSQGFDVVVMGEGEETFLELVQKVESNESFLDNKGIAFKDFQGNFKKNCARSRVKTIDEFPMPDWDNWFIEEYISRGQSTGINLGRTIPILGSRGCPYACTFCSNEAMWTRRYIMREPKSIVDEMEFLKKKYNVDSFAFMDSTFIINRRKTLEFANQLIERKLNITYQIPAGTRCEAFDDELALGLEKSGLKNFAFAPESGSSIILKAIKKQIDIPRLLQAAESVLKTNMTVGCFIVIGFPEDTKTTLKETLKLVRKLALMGVHDLTVSQFTPYPGSPYFEQFQKQGMFSEDLTELDNIISFFNSEGISYSSSLSSKELYFWMFKLLIHFYLLSFIIRPWRPLKVLWINLTQNIESTRYMRLFNEILFRRQKWRNG